MGYGRGERLTRRRGRARRRSTPDRPLKSDGALPRRENHGEISARRIVGGLPKLPPSARPGVTEGELGPMGGPLHRRRTLSRARLGRTRRARSDPQMDCRRDEALSDHDLPRGLVGYRRGERCDRLDVYNPKKDAPDLIKGWIAAGGKFKTPDQVKIQH